MKNRDICNFMENIGCTGTSRKCEAQCGPGLIVGIIAYILGNEREFTFKLSVYLTWKLFADFRGYEIGYSLKL